MNIAWLLGAIKSLLLQLGDSSAIAVIACIVVLYSIIKSGWGTIRFVYGPTVLFFCSAYVQRSSTLQIVLRNRREAPVRSSVTRISLYTAQNWTQRGLSSVILPQPTVRVAF